MPISDRDMTRIVYNRVIGGKSYTSTDLSLDEEPFNGRLPQMLKDVWVDDIPTKNPLSNNNDYDHGSTHPPSGIQIIKKWHKAVMKPVTTSSRNISFYIGEDFSDIIPSEYGDGSYQWQLWRKGGSGGYDIAVPFGMNSWHFDPVNGVLTFLEGFPQGIDNLYNPPAMTVYQYIGRKGSPSLFGGGSSEVDGDTISIDSDDSIFISKEYRQKSYVKDSLDSNVSLSSNVYTITHGLNTKFLNVHIYEKDGLTYSPVFVPMDIINNSQVKLSFSEYVTSGDFAIKIVGSYL